jgi:hypothetical protein
VISPGFEIGIGLALVWLTMSDAAVLTSSLPAAPASPPPASGPSLWAPGGFGFKDLLDIVNPLQHLPVIGSIYRYLTGDEPSGGARIVGDTIYGGPIGFGVGVVSTLLTDSQGHDLGEKALAAVFGPGPSSAKTTEVAKASTQAAPSASPAALPLPQSAAAMATRPPATTPLPADPTRLAAQLYRSPPPLPAAQPASPEQKFLAQTARFQRQLTTTETTDGRVLNNRPVPLELTGNLMPARRLNMAPATGPRPAGPAAPPPSQQAATPALNPIARKMLDALDKYERLKKQQAQEDSLKAGAPPATDLSL